MTGASGKTILITGATSGVGLEAAVALAARGAHVSLVGRDPERTRHAVEEVKRRAQTEKVDSFLCDFKSQKEIRRLNDEFRQKHDRLDVLVNNAGTVFKDRTVTEDGIEATFAVNHLGYYLLTRLLLDLLVVSAPSRVVIVASEGHRHGTLDFDDLGFERGGYGIMKAYGRSKLGNLLFARELARRVRPWGVTVNALHPGAVATRIWDGAPSWTKPVLAVLKKLFMVSPEQGGKTLVQLAASEEVEGKTGLYFVDMRPVSPSARAQDDALATRLWDVSAQRVHLPPSDSASGERGIRTLDTLSDMQV